MDFEAFGLVMTACVVIAYLWQKVVKPLVDVLAAVIVLAFNHAEKAALRAAWLAVVNLWPFYTSAIFGTWLAWYTGLNFLPIFAQSPLVGRIASCVTMAMGPSAAFDLYKQVGEWREKLGGAA